MNGIHDYHYTDFIRDHEASLKSSCIPELYWERLHAKLKAESFDAGSVLEIQKLVYENGDFDHELHVCVDKLYPDDPQNIFLIDHAWSFKLPDAEKNLGQIAGLVNRMANIMGLNPSSENLQKRVLDNLWKFARVYQISLPDPDHPQLPAIPQSIWYVMDEVGAAIQHSDTPTIRIVPFLYRPKSICYTLIFPIRPLKQNDPILADFVAHVPAELRKCKLYPWFDEDFSKESALRSHCLTEDFFAAHRIGDDVGGTDRPMARPTAKYRVFTEMKPVRASLAGSAHFELVDTLQEAHIWWAYTDVSDLREVRAKGVLLNQFMGEHVLTVKDLLAALASHPQVIELTGEGPECDISGKPLTASWYPVSFNLKHELRQFLAHFQRTEQYIERMREKVGKCSPGCPRHTFRHRRESDPDCSIVSNVWICKPWNLGRGLEIAVTESAEQVVAMSEGIPLLASRYIADPVLFHREDISANVKFDMRYMLFLRSVNPLNLYVHKVFWLRFANEEFALKDWNNYARHFTVMNYREDDELKQTHHDEFIRLFEAQHPSLKWESVEASIFEAVKKIVAAGTHFAYPRGLLPSEHCRAMYAVDLMLEWQTDADHCHRVVPQICEVNFNADCTRACKYYPDFYEQACSALFLDEDEFLAKYGNNFTKLI